MGVIAGCNTRTVNADTPTHPLLCTQEEGGPDGVEDDWKPAVPDFSHENYEDRCPSKFEYLQVRCTTFLL